MPGAVVKPVPAQRPWFVQPLIAGAIIALAGLVAYQGVLSRLDLWLYDALLVPATRESRAVAVVLVDDAALDRMQARQIDYPVIARLLDEIAAAQPRLVVLMLPLALLDPQPAEVQELQRAIRAAPPVVARVEPWTDAPGAWRPHPEIERLAVAVGQSVFVADDDGVVRGAMLAIKAGGREYEHVALIAARAVAGPSAVPAWETGTLASDDFNRRSLLFRPTAPKDRAIRLSDLQRDPALAAGLAGRVVIVASGMAGARTVQTSGLTADQRNTALVAADVVEALLAGEAIRPLRQADRALLAMLVAALAVLLLPRLRSPWPAVAAVAGVLLLLGVGAWMLNVGHRALPLAAPALWTLAIGLGWAAARGVRTERALTRQLNVVGQHSALELALVPPAAAAALGEGSRSRLDSAIEAGERIERLLELLESVIDQLPVGVAIHDDDGRLLLGNRAFDASIRRLPGAHTGVGRVPDAYRRMADASDGLELPDGTVQAVSRHVLQLRGGRAVSVLAVADVTALRAAETRRRSLLGFLGHDLRTPLAAIVAAVDEGNPMARDIDRLREVVRTQATRALRLADQFGALVKAEAADDSGGTTNLARAADEAADEVYESLRAAGCRLRRDLPEDATVAAEHRLLVRAVVNLLDNAIKASPEGAEIVLRIESVRGAHELQVDNQVRVDAADRERPAGLGLGLLLVRTVALRSGGEFALRGLADFTVRASLRLPAVEGTADGGADASATAIAIAIAREGPS